MLLFEKLQPGPGVFEVAADEGAHVTFLDSNSSQMEKRVFGRYSKGIGRFYDGTDTGF